MNRRLAQTLILGTIFSLLIAAIAIAWYTRERQYGIYSDDVAIYEEASRTAPRDILWQPAEILKQLVDAEIDVFEPMVSYDGLSLYFVKGKPGENTDIYTAMRTTEGWSTPVPATGINTDADELGPEMSADATRLFFYSDREGGNGGYDIWMAERDATGAWGDAVNLGANVNSDYNEYGLTISRDGETIYFSSNRPQPGETDIIDDDAWPATLREERYVRDYDLYVTHLTDRGWSDPQPVDELNSVFNDGSPALSPFGDFLYMSSDRPGGVGGYDIYRVRIHPDGLGAIETIDEAINTQAHELDATLAMGGYQLLFSSNRPTSALLDEAEGAEDTKRPPYQIYSSTSREVYMQYRTARAAIDWEKILPWLFWLLFTLMVLALLWLLHRLMKSERYGKLSLLARCLLVSGIVHALIVLLLGLWGVGNSLMDWSGRSRGTQVVITTPQMGDSLARQVRGELTSFEVNEAFDVEAAEQTPLEQMDPSLVEMAVERAALDVEQAELRDTADAATQQPEIELAQTTADQAPDDASQPDVSTPELAARAASAEAMVQIQPDQTDVSRAREQLTAEQLTAAAALDVQPSQIQSDRQHSAADALHDASASTTVEPPALDANIALPQAEESSDVAVDIPTQQTPTASSESTLTIQPQQDQQQRTESQQVDGAQSSAAEALVQLPADASQVQDAQRFATHSEQAADAFVPDVTIPDRADSVAIGESDTRLDVDLPNTSAAQSATSEERRVESVTDRLSDAAASSVRIDVPDSVSAAHVATDATRIEAAQSSTAIEIPADSTLLRDMTLPAASTDDIALPAFDESLIEIAELPDAAALPTQSDEAAANTEHAARMESDRADMRELDAADTDITSALNDVASASVSKQRLDVALPDVPDSQSVLAMPDVPMQDIAMPALDAPDAFALPTDAAPPASTDDATPETTTDEIDAAMSATRAESMVDSADAGALDNLIEAEVDQADQSRAWSSPDLLMHDALLEAERDPLEDTSMVIVLDRSEAGLSDIELPTETQLPFVPDAAPTGVVFGQVIDAMTGDVISGASVYLDLSGDVPTNAKTDDRGRYSMIPSSSDLPEFVAVSASKDGYIPATANVAADAVKGAMYRLDFELMPADAAVIVLEADPEVHHLGDNSFSGRINSQFQKESEGLQYNGSFRLTQQQLESCEDEVEFRVLARGTQRDNPVRINGRMLDEYLNDSPGDGSFGEYRIRFPAEWLREGRNRIRINSVGRDDDPDDFEFVNIRIFLTPRVIARAEREARRRGR